MIKHEESLEKLWNYLISNQLDKAEEQYELVHQVLEEQEKKDELLGLYREFIEELKIDYFCESFNEENGEYNELEYLDIGGATDKSIELLKQIKALEEEMK